MLVSDDKIRDMVRNAGKEKSIKSGIAYYIQEDASRHLRAGALRIYLPMIVKVCMVDSVLQGTDIVLELRDKQDRFLTAASHLFFANFVFCKTMSIFQLKKYGRYVPNLESIVEVAIKFVYDSELYRRLHGSDDVVYMTAVLRELTTNIFHAYLNFVGLLGEKLRELDDKIKRLERMSTRERYRHREEDLIAVKRSICIIAKYISRENLLCVVDYLCCVLQGIDMLIDLVGWRQLPKMLNDAFFERCHNLQPSMLMVGGSRTPEGKKLTTFYSQLHIPVDVMGTMLRIINHQAERQQEVDDAKDKGGKKEKGRKVPGNVVFDVPKQVLFLKKYRSRDATKLEKEEINNIIRWLGQMNCGECRNEDPDQGVATGPVKAPRADGFQTKAGSETHACRSCGGSWMKRCDDEGFDEHLTDGGIRVVNERGGKKGKIDELYRFHRNAKIRVDNAAAAYCPKNIADTLEKFKETVAPGSRHQGQSAEAATFELIVRRWLCDIPEVLMLVRNQDMCPTYFFAAETKTTFEGLSENRRMFYARARLEILDGDGCAKELFSGFVEAYMAKLPVNGVYAVERIAFNTLTTPGFRAMVKKQQRSEKKQVELSEHIAELVEGRVCMQYIDEWGDMVYEFRDYGREGADRRLKLRNMENLCVDETLAEVRGMVTIHNARILAERRLAELDGLRALCVKKPGGKYLFEEIDKKRANNIESDAAGSL